MCLLCGDNRFFFLCWERKETFKYCIFFFLFSFVLAAFAVDSLAFLLSLRWEKKRKVYKMNLSLASRT